MSRLLNSSFKLLKASCVLAVLAAVTMTATGCGYGFHRGGATDVLARKGVRRIYIAPLENQTYKAGVDHVVYNELLRSVAAFDRVRVVRSPDQADAVLKGVVRTASYSSSAATYAINVFPKGVGTGTTTTKELQNVPVATEYTASLECSFTLEKEKATLWSSSFNRSRPFAGNNQLGGFGTTSGLINESEFDRSLRDMAESMMADVNESMLAMF